MSVPPAGRLRFEGAARVGFNGRGRGCQGVFSLPHRRLYLLLNLGSGEHPLCDVGLKSATCREVKLFDQHIFGRDELAAFVLAHLAVQPLDELW